MVESINMFLDKASIIWFWILKFLDLIRFLSFSKQIIKKIQLSSVSNYDL